MTSLLREDLNHIYIYSSLCLNNWTFIKWLFENPWTLKVKMSFNKCIIKCATTIRCINTKHTVYLPAGPKLQWESCPLFWFNEVVVAVCFCRFLSCSVKEAAVEWHRFQQAGLLWRPPITTEVSEAIAIVSILKSSTRSMRLFPHWKCSILHFHSRVDAFSGGAVVVMPQSVQANCYQNTSRVLYGGTSFSDAFPPHWAGLALTLEPVLLSQCSVVC